MRRPVMQAWVSHEPGEPSSLRLEEVPVPAPGPNEVLVRVQGVGINFPDSLIIADRYQVRPPRPFTPGSEFCGDIVAVGAAVSTHQVGALVAGFGRGALAEYVTVDATQVIPLPAGTSPIDAAALLFTYTTAYYALRDVGEVRSGETVVVLGAGGGVGTATVELARALGATVIACASSREKVAFAETAGADTTIVYDPTLKTSQEQKQFTRALCEAAPQGIDLVLDPVGGPYAEPALRSLAPGGRYLVVGFTAGIPRIPLNVPLLASSSIIGVDWSHLVRQNPDRNTQLMVELVDMWQRNLIRPRVSRQFDFVDAPTAIDFVASRRVKGKVVVALARQPQENATPHDRK
ncbi:NADPH:quinone oxidoreductase family protein [Microbacterium sp. A93]|uniref:NADPH:quinone oxidoreductase family protein n=1 Tax=Microbacterium sp. A93 TaxID=3450716 RepID=UPI003F42B723